MKAKKKAQLTSTLGKIIIGLLLLIVLILIISALYPAIKKAIGAL